MKSAVKWSDINDDDLNLDEVEGFVTTIGDIKVSTTFSETPEGMMKIITKSKVHRRVDTCSRKAEQRLEAMRAMRDSETEDLSNACEDSFIELPRNMRKVDEEGEDAGYGHEKEAGAGLPMLRRDAVKDKFMQIRLGVTGDRLPDDQGNHLDHAQERDEPEPSDAKYVAPRGRLTQKDDCTVRVTNLSEETKEDDLEDLFGRIGKISRIYLAKDKETKSSKGFAFITYEDRHTAEKAIRSLDRHGYDSLLLKVEWAKPSTKGRD